MNRQKKQRTSVMSILTRVLVFVCVGMYLSGAGQWMGLQQGGLAEAKDRAVEAQSEELGISIQDQFAQMDDMLEITPEEKEALEQEALQRSNDSEMAADQYEEWLASIQNANAETIESVDEPRISDAGFAALQAINPDLVGWLWIENSAIDYPMVQGNDNTYYMDHLLDGTQNKSGTIFMDYRNDGNFEDQNTLIYGHHMKSGAMFAELVNYQKEGYYAQHPKMMLYTPQGDYEVEFFAGYTVPIRNVAMPCFFMTYADQTEFMECIQEAKQRSSFESDVEVMPEDRIVTLVTCTYEVYDARYVLQGKLISVGDVLE